MPQGKEGSQGGGSDLGELPELKPTVASFLQGSPETSDEEGINMPPEPNIMDFSLWAQWRAEMCETLEWWEELLAVPGNMDMRKLARQVRASFLLPQQLWEWDTREATLQAPLQDHVFKEKGSCPQPIQSSCAGIFSKSHERRQ